jgi:PAS domain S-box-containing protein
MSPYEAYFEFAPDALVLVDEHGRIVRSNLSADRIFGYSLGELQGQSIEVLVPEGLRRTHEKHRLRFMAEPRSRPVGPSLNLAARRKDGSEFPVEISLTYAETDAGSFVVCNISDITGRLTRESEDRRREALTMLGTTVAGIAHDLNNPLSVIISRAELLLVPGVELTSQTRSDVEVIYRHARRASRIIQDLLALTRQDPRPHETVNLNEVVSRALLLVEGQMLREGKKIIVDLTADLPMMMGNPVSLEQVLVNLLSNARDAMAAGSIVKVRTARSNGQADWIELAVSDNGCGIPPDALSKLFRFLYTTKPGGTGLGLWLAKRTAIEHGGTIEVDSKVGKGSTFMLRFPAAPSLHAGNA